VGGQRLKAEEDKLKAYLDQKISVSKISKEFMKIRYDAIVRKIKEKGWLVWRGRGKKGHFTTI
jgi:hypothetical protein